jgi:tetratricopeptide (TPR) repeat protein
MLIDFSSWKSAINGMSIGLGWSRDVNKSRVKSMKRLALRLIAKLHLREGIYYTKKARRSSGAEADRLSQTAYEKYAAALKANPKLHDALKGWGHTLFFATQNKSLKEQVKLYQQACEKYAAAHDIKPDDRETLYFWGLALSQQAKGTPAKNSDELYRLAYEKFSEAVALDRKDPKALHHWGLALYEQAQIKRGTEAQELYQAACEKYSAALALAPNKPDVMNDWGAALKGQAGLAAGDTSAALYKQAQEKLLAAEALVPGIASYNLACIHSLRGEYEECRKHLESARDHKSLPPFSYIKNDADLGKVRQLEWFRELIKTLRTSKA